MDQVRVTFQRQLLISISFQMQALQSSRIPAQPYCNGYKKCENGYFVHEILSQWISYGFTKEIHVEDEHKGMPIVTESQISMHINAIIRTIVIAIYHYLLGHSTDNICKLN